MISVDEALDRILERVPVLEPVPVALPDCLGLVLAEDVEAAEDLPPFANSAVDGYAVRAADTPGTLEVVGEVFAGQVASVPVGPGQAVRIMTGAMVPEGADACVMVERTSLSGTAVTVEEVGAGQHVRPAGENVRRGQSVLRRGAELSPAWIGMAATLGRASLRCHPRPRVAVLSTGDELVEPGEPLAPGKIRNSNSYALEAQVRTAGALPVRLPVVPDMAAEVEARLREAVSGADLVVTSAGVSVGEHDYVKDAIARLGGEMVFWKVRMRPGKPLAFGVAGRVPMIGLPGNPVSSMVGFEVFVRPALRKMAGFATWEPPTVTARLAETARKVAGLRFFDRCLLSSDGQGFVARPTGPQGSGILLSMGLADGLADLPEEAQEIPAGTSVSVRLLRGWNSWGPSGIHDG